MNEFIVQWLPTVANATIVGAGFLVFKKYLPKYFEKKGENLATKEDIEEITSLVEGTKILFTNQTESLKANLQLFTNLRVGIAGEERNAIVDFNQKYSRWASKIMDIALSNADQRDNDSLNKAMGDINEAYSEVQYSLAKFELFIEDFPLKGLAHNLIASTMVNLNSNPVNHIKNLLSINTETERLPTLSLPSAVFSEELRVLGVKRTESLNEFRKSIIDGFTIVRPLTIQFQDSCRVYIHRLLQ